MALVMLYVAYGQILLSTFDGFILICDSKHCTLKNRVHFKNRDRRKQKPLAKVVEFFKIKTFS